MQVNYEYNKSLKLSTCKKSVEPNNLVASCQPCQQGGKQSVQTHPTEKLLKQY